MGLLDGAAWEKENPPVQATGCIACLEKDDRYPHTCKTKHTSECTIWNGAGVCSCTKPDKPQDIEGVRTPSHYMLFDDIEAIEVIARSMTREQFKGYCLGNILKYRLRAGKKSELAFLEKDMAKAGFYGELYEKHKGKCYA
ncbi:hypothetical protein FIVT_0009 [Erwinia phage FE44]|uniref:Nucleotide kinase n=1 Tax=Erwinia phage FE44 TaxID=1407608 RepID=U5P0E3_9CAUD|nr:nucleotide kinase [Erwinia phage FE44]AGY36908.1 hypothetical protein FIVT_0009 [Erwinia phage FE44]